MKRRLRLPPTASGRLDRALADLLGVGRAAVKAAFRAGAVRSGGHRLRPSHPAEPGLEVEVEIADRATTATAGPPPGTVPGDRTPVTPVPDDWTPVPDDRISLVILLESDRFLLVDKPAGIPTHPLRAGEGATLAGTIAARFPECADASLDPREGGAAHRLDRETSGCVLFARDRGAWLAFRAQFSARTVEKVYLALVRGEVAAGGVCSVPLVQRGRRAIPVPDDLAVARQASKGAGPPRAAETHFEPVRRFPGATLLEVRIPTGATHQIRAHLAWLGHPVLGDLRYGGEAARIPDLARLGLHAAILAFDPPGGGPRVRVESPLPPDLEALLGRT